MEKCTHTSDWWKNHTQCPLCYELYSDEKADAIANEHPRILTLAQQEIIKKLEFHGMV